MHISSSSKIYTAQSKIPNSGRGVFASVDIKKGEVIERCPYLHIPEYEVEHLNETFLVTYFYYLGEKKDRVVLLLGYGSLYNHADKPNASYKEQQSYQAMDIIALRDIQKDEEITVHYNPSETNSDPLWFV